MTSTQVVPGEAVEGVTQVPLKGIRRIGARRMVAAWAAPVFHLTAEVDMTSALAVSRQPGITVTDVLLRATARALLANPGLNAHYADEVVSLHAAVNLGIAVSTEAGLTVPVVHGLESASLAEISERRKDVVTRARIGKLERKDVEGATFTVSNLGMLGVDRFDAILNPPQVGILAVGSTRPRVVVRDGEMQVRPIAELTLTCDHRAVDGAAGAGLLARLRAELEADAPDDA